MKRDSSRQMSIGRDLRDRKVIQWGLGYAAAALAVMEGVDVVGDDFSWSPAIFRVFAVAAATGFLLTLVLACYHGMHGRQRWVRVEVVLVVLIEVNRRTDVGARWSIRGLSNLLKLRLAKRHDSDDYERVWSPLQTPALTLVSSC